MTETWATVIWPCGSRTRQVTSWLHVCRRCLSSFLSSVMKGQGPKRHIQQCASNLDLGSDQPRGYFGCADFVLFFSMRNINNRCWLSTDTEINRWQRKILDCFFASRGRGVKIIWMTPSAARPSGTQMFRGSSLCDGGDQLRSAGSFPHRVQQAPVQPLLRPSAVLMAAHRGVTDHVCAYLLILHHSEPSRGNHIGCWCLDRGAKSKTRPPPPPPPAPPPTHTFVNTQKEGSAYQWGPLNIWNL